MNFFYIHNNIESSSIIEPSEIVSLTKPAQKKKNYERKNIIDACRPRQRLNGTLEKDAFKKYVHEIDYKKKQVSRFSKIVCSSE